MELKFSAIDICKEEYFLNGLFNEVFSYECTWNKGTEFEHIGQSSDPNKLILCVKMQDEKGKVFNTVIKIYRNENHTFSWESEISLDTLMPSITSELVESYKQINNDIDYLFETRWDRINYALKRFYMIHDHVMAQKEEKYDK